MGRDIPIPFRNDMVVALLDDTKTQTRRPAWRINEPTPDGEGMTGSKPTRWQKVRVGDRLWVRENYYFGRGYDELPPRDVPTIARLWYAATPDRTELAGKLRPAMFMPRWASRITLTVTEVKIEPLCSISHRDAVREGFQEGRLNDGFAPRAFGTDGTTIESPGTFASASGMFLVYYQKLHPKWDGYSSPDVVAISFEVHRGNIDALRG